MMVGAMPVGRSYPAAATVAGLVQLERARAAWKLSLNFFLSYNYFSLLSYFSIAFSFLSRKSNLMVKCVTEVTQRLDVDVDEIGLVLGIFLYILESFLKANIQNRNIFGGCENFTMNIISQ